MKPQSFDGLLDRYAKNGIALTVFTGVLGLLAGINQVYDQSYDSVWDVTFGAVPTVLMGAVVGATVGFGGWMVFDAIGHNNGMAARAKAGKSLTEPTEAETAARV